jgi:hypothetical protein
MPDYMRKGDLLNFRYEQGRPQFNASSSILNSVPLRIQLKDFMDEQAKINKDTITKFKIIDNVLENINSKVTEVRSHNHQVLNMMKMIETQVRQLVGHLSANEGKLPDNLKVPRWQRPFKLVRGSRPKIRSVPRVKSWSTWVLTSKTSPTNPNDTLEQVNTHWWSNFGQRHGQTPPKR